MRIIKLFIITFIFLNVMLTGFAQSKVKIPQELHGFWHFEPSHPLAWDGSSIGEGYVEFRYKHYYVEEIQKLSENSYRIKLYHPQGEPLELTITDLTTDQAKLHFSVLPDVKVCQRLDYAVGTNLMEVKDLPEYIFQDWSEDMPWTSEKEEIPFCTVRKNGMIEYDNKQWDILWVSWHQKKEYRLFIRHKELYTMLYIHKLQPTKMVLACDYGKIPLKPFFSNKAEELTCFDAKEKLPVPNELHGFWHFKANQPNGWDGTSIGDGYVEFAYKYYYVEKVRKTAENSYHLKLFHPSGLTNELSISEITKDQAKLKFSGWSEAKVCQRLAYAVGTELKELSELPDFLFQEWTDNNQGVPFCKIEKTGTVSYDDKQWDIQWVSWHNNKEYRLFLRHNDLYQMLYIHKLDANQMILASDAGRPLLYPVATVKNIYKLLGNWAEKRNNNWRFGFFEKFAIYNNEFWECKSFNFKGKKAKVVLTKGNEQLNLKVKFNNDSVCYISINDAPKQAYFKCGKYLPAYSKPDTLAFLDTEFEYVDTVTIHGYLRHNTIDKPFSVGFQNPVTDEQDEYYANMDSLGRFTIRFPLINTTEVFIDWGRTMKIGVAQPGETYFLYYDCKTKQYLIMGDNERFHNELASYQPYYGKLSYREQNRVRSLSNTDYLSYQKEFLANANQHLVDYIIQNPNVSERFKYYHWNNYRFTSARNLLQRRFKIPNWHTGGRFEKGFMEYVDGTLYQDKPVVPYTLVRSYLSFMRDYFGYKSTSINENAVSISYIEAVKYLEETNRIKLEEDELQIVEHYIEMQDELKSLDKSTVDSLYLDNLSADYQKALKLVNPIFLKVQKEIGEKAVKDVVDEMFINIRAESALEKIDTHFTDPLLKELLVTNLFYEVLEGLNATFADNTLSIFNANVTKPALTRAVLKLNESFTLLEQQDIRYQESLKKTEHLNDAQNADSLLTQLLEPYIGNVIYLDIWGTWCGPCKDQMQYVGAIKEALKDKDVVFMYLANNSPETTWKNVIKVNQLSGPNVVHYRLPDIQQNMLERRLSINSFPTYILIDKQGNIVNMEAPRPQQKNYLIQEINKLL